MPRIPIFKLGSTTAAQPPRLHVYTPAIALEGLQLGIDNLRHDVWLSPAFTKAAGVHIAKLIAKWGNIEGVVAAATGSPGANRGMFSKFIPAQPKKVQDLKPLLLELHKSALVRAKSEGNLTIDLLARTDITKFLRAELNSQFAAALDRCRATLREYEGVRQQKALEYRETVAAFQIAKKNILRQVGQELFRILRDIERETLATMRRSLFGDEATVDYQMFLHQFIFVEEGRDSYLAAEHYVLIGGFENDPDSFGNIRALTCEFLKTVLPEAEFSEAAAPECWLNAPENAHELVGTGESSEREHRARLQTWTELLERERVEKLVEDHGKLSLDSLTSAAGRITQAGSGHRAKTAARFLHDFLRYHRELRRVDALNRAIEKINLITGEKLCDLSRLNGTLYDFLLPEESKITAEKS